MWKKIGILAITLWWPISGFAIEQTAPEKVLPGLSGSLDGEPREWFILSYGNDSNASFIERGDDIDIDITGFVDEEVWEAQEALSVSLTMREEELINTVVIHPLGTSMAPPLYTSEGGDVVVTLTDYERTNQWVHVVGRIQGVMALQIELGEPPSREEGIEIDVTFDVKAQKIEF